MTALATLLTGAEPVRAPLVLNPLMARSLNGQDSRRFTCAVER